MKLRFIYLIIVAFLFTGCEKVPSKYNEVNTLFTSKQWHLAYIKEDRGIGPVLYNDSYNTTHLFFNSDKTIKITIDNREYYGTWELETIGSSSLLLLIDIPELSYLSHNWVIKDIYRWGYEQIRVVLFCYDFDRGINMEMGLN